jgi:hypothetical protein
VATKRQRAAAARRGWETRRANATRARRAEAARRAWRTRRANTAARSAAARRGWETRRRRRGGGGPVGGSGGEDSDDTPDTPRRDAGDGFDDALADLYSATTDAGLLAAYDDILDSGGDDDFEDVEIESSEPAQYEDS